MTHNWDFEKRLTSMRKEHDKRVRRTMLLVNVAITISYIALFISVLALGFFAVKLAENIEANGGVGRTIGSFISDVQDGIEEGNSNDS